MTASWSDCRIGQLLVADLQRVAMFLANPVVPGQNA